MALWNSRPLLSIVSAITLESLPEQQRRSQKHGSNQMMLQMTIMTSTLPLLVPSTNANPATLHSQHIQGHQDTKANQPLMIEEQLNVDCDHQAKQYVLSTDKSSVAFGNPDIPKARPHISINGKLICHKLLPALCYALSAPNYS